jgi:Putative adhesin
LLNMNMRPKLLTLFVVAALAASARPAAAQVYPERVPSARARVQQQRDRARVSRDQGRDEQTERTTRTLRIGATGELDVANIAGDILISRGAGQDATLEIVKTARAQSPDDAKALLGMVQVDVVERAGRAEVRTRYPSGDEMRTQNRRNVNVSVAYTITAPVGARITARSISGNVSARDLHGELTLESVSGNLTIASAGRVTSAKTISGNVEIAGTEIDGAMEASSVSGTVAVRRSKARRLTLSTVSGDLALEDVDCGRVGMQAVSGNIQISGALSPEGRYDLTSHSGDVRILLSGSTGFELDANSFSGSIRSDLPLTGTSGGAERGRRQRAMRGVYGNGSAVLDLKTFSGSISISKR